MFCISCLFISSGSDLLSRVLRQSTISATGFNDRVRNGIGWDTCAITTGTNKQTSFKDLIYKHPTYKNFQKQQFMRDLNHTFEIIKSIRLLVLVSFNTSLCLHPQPINVVVYHDPNGDTLF